MNLVYQMWDGPPMPQGEEAGMRAMREYVARIGERYHFASQDKFFPDLPPAYGRFRPIYSEYYDRFENILYADVDVWPVQGLTASPFDDFSGDLGICTEPLQPKFRAAATSGICFANDEAWAKVVKKTYGIEMPRDKDGLLKIYNSGVQLWSFKGRIGARERFADMADYRARMKKAHLPPFYATDQHYLHAMMFYAKLDIVEMDNDWNRFIHYQPYPEVCDQRTPTTKFVHVQLRNAGKFSAEKLHRIVNLPRAEWGPL